MYCLRNRDSPGITLTPPPKKKIGYFLCLLSFNVEKRWEASVSKQTCFCWGDWGWGWFHPHGYSRGHARADCGTVLPRSSSNRWFASFDLLTCGGAGLRLARHSLRWSQCHRRRVRTCSCSATWRKLHLLCPRMILSTSSMNSEVKFNVY